MSKSVSDPPVVDLEEGSVVTTVKEAASDDLEKGSVATVIEVEEKAIVLDAWNAKVVSLVMDALFGAYALFFGGMMGYAIKYSTDWVQVLRCFMVILPFMLWNLCLIPQLKKLAVKVLAKKKPSYEAAARTILVPNCWHHHQRNNKP